MASKHRLQHQWQPREGAVRDQPTNTPPHVAQTPPSLDTALYLATTAKRFSTTLSPFRNSGPPFQSPCLSAPVARLRQDIPMPQSVYRTCIVTLQAANGRLWPQAFNPSISRKAPNHMTAYIRVLCLSTNSTERHLKHRGSASPRTPKGAFTADA